MIIDEVDYEKVLMHYGTKRHSGRYPWGSGGNEDNSKRDYNSFLEIVNDLRRQGMSEQDIAVGFGLSTTDLRNYKTRALAEQRNAKIQRAVNLREKGMSFPAIGRQMGINESSVRSLIAASLKDDTNILESTMDVLRANVDQHKYIDVSKGVENHIGISREKLRAAVSMLEDEGYQLRYIQEPQIGTGKNTNIKVLTPPGTTYAEVSKNRDQIRQIFEYSDDLGRTWNPLLPPLAVNPKRVGINYAEDGGAQADGVIYVRPGVKDLSLGNNRYAQVRIQVGPNHYLKGMAVVKDDLPDGVDLLFNTNKSDTGNKLDALKKIESDDPTNPFGATIRQITETGTGGKKRVTSAMNIVNEEGDWDDWSRNLSTQFLSKQSPKLAREQLNMTYERRQEEFDRIMSLTNPVVKKRLLQEFSEGTDAAAVHLKAAALPRQVTRVILPVNSLKETEVYAPGLKNGESVALVRYPHGGTFEIPVLTVNNRNQAAKKLLGEGTDAIGINAKVAERLSGADFDGDTVIVMPNDNRRVVSTPALEGLRNFDPRSQYKAYEGMKPISQAYMQKQMGDVSNLITDMSLRKAPPSELARAVKHSMVVIDSYKHNLDYRQSAIDNNIAQLKQKYQKDVSDTGSSGATTLISRATSQTRVPDRRLKRVSEGGPINPKTGELEYTYSGKTYVDKNGRKVLSTTRSEKLAETKDANALSSGTPMERIYADHSNKLKAMANQARLEMINTPPAKWNSSAKTVYASEVKRLDAALNRALMNAPLERQAQLIANAAAKARIAANPMLDKDQQKRIENQELAKARALTGAGKDRVVITDREWEAIQAGAISSTKLKAILDNADMDRVRELATPRQALLMTPTKLKRAQSMMDLGFDRGEIANALGVSLSTLDESLKGDES
jgi:DNA-binding CsgD family transcriptional regulator